MKNEISYIIEKNGNGKYRIIEKTNINVPGLPNIHLIIEPDNDIYPYNKYSFDSAKKALDFISKEKKWEVVE